MGADAQIIENLARAELLIAKAEALVKATIQWVIVVNHRGRAPCAKGKHILQILLISLAELREEAGGEADNA